jgi:hypothetical protein
LRYLRDSVYKAKKGEDVQKTKAMIAAVLALLCLSVCVADEPSMRQKFSLKGPEKSVLVYGALLDANGKHYNELQFFQVNTALQPQNLYIMANWRMKFWFVKDVIPGGSFKLKYYNKQKGNVIYYDSPSLQGKTDADFCTPVTPGLYYYGVCRISDGDFKLEKNPEEEITILGNLLGKVVGTPWEPLVKSRMEELKNEKK